MRVKFWGTRGSLAKPGHETARYGGNTSCVEVRTNQGTLVVIDCGTGVHGLGQSLLAAHPRGGIRGHLFISHTHWDHIQGFPFFGPLFVPGNEWDIYGPKGLDQSVRESLAGQMQYTYFPVTMEQFGAKVCYHDLVEGSLTIDDFSITARYLNHPALTLGYRLQADGASLVYACDHEPWSKSLAAGTGELSGPDERHAEFLRGADLVLHDAQYTAEEYPAKAGWGHSSIEYAVRIAQFAGVGMLALTHHDPARSDEALDRLVEKASLAVRDAGSSLEVIAAAEGRSIEVRAKSPSAPESMSAESQVSALAGEPNAHRLILLAGADSELETRLIGAIGEDSVRLQTIPDPSNLGALVEREAPALVILAHNPPRFDGLAACQAIRQSRAGEAASIPVILIATREDFDAGDAAGVTEWITLPTTDSYLRTKVRASVLRTTCQWQQAPVPEDEEDRLSALKALHILDTVCEPRFDRITRLAAALFDVPVALISLVDHDRQWFKSRVGVELTESTKDLSCCSHVVYSRKMTVIPDLLRDSRFADNPMVTCGPRIRFYAGAPLILDSGRCVGTLCLIDTRPRRLDEGDEGHLRDLRDVVLEELQRKDVAPPVFKEAGV